MRSHLDDEPYKQMEYDASQDSTHQSVNIRMRQVNADRREYLSKLKTLIAEQKLQAPL